MKLSTSLLIVGNMFQRVQCGEHYTVAGTVDNDILYWGTRFKHPPKLDESWSSGGGSRVKRSESCPEPSSSSPKRSSHSRQASATSLSSVKEEGAGRNVKMLVKY